MKPSPFLIGTLLLVVFVTTVPAGAEAWPRGHGKVYAWFGWSGIHSDESYDPDGERIPFPGRDTEEQRASMYVELGLDEVWTLVLNAPWKNVIARGLVSEFETSGAADLDLRIRYSRRASSSGFFAIEGGAFVPLGYDEKEFPQLGTGETDWILNAAWGSSLSWLPQGFVSVDAGYRIRGGDLADEVPYAAKIGAFPHDRIGLFALVRGWESRADFAGLDPSFGLVSSNSERVVAGAEIYIRLTSRVDVNATWSRVVGGRNTGIGDEIGFGVAWHGW